MRTRHFLLLFFFFTLTACKSLGEECGGCRLRYCDEAPSRCDCDCFDGDVQSGAVCKSGCFQRPADLGTTQDCSNVGCAAPPLCSTGCTAPCGCCPCSDGTQSGGLRCQGGCYVPADMK